MARRRATFGRYPRVQQNLTSTIIAIARDMQAQRDRNIMDAWEDGGTFEGEPVSDQKVLQYWRARMNGLDKEDPQFEEIKSNILQLTYGIEQSEMDLKYVSGKIGEAEYARFFLKWAKRAPRNSEWWRTLQKDAAQLMERAKANAKAAGEKAKQDAFNAFVKDRNRDIGLGNALTDAMQQMSEDSGLSITGNGDRLLQMLSEDYRNNPDKYRALGDAIRTSGVEFGGTFTHKFWTQSLDNAGDAYDDVADRSKREGYADAYNTAVRGQSDMASWASNTDAWPVAKAYDRAYRRFAAVWDDPSISYLDKQAAAAAFSATVAKLAARPGIDESTKAMLEADALRAQGEDAGDSPSFGAAMLGRPGVTPEHAAQVAAVREAQDMMTQNPGQFSYAPVTPDGQFDPTGQGPIGIVPNSAVPSNSVFIVQPQLNGKAAMVAVQPNIVYADDPNNPNGAPTPVGSVISYRVGGRTVTMYSYADNTGRKHWTLSSPWADGITAGRDKDGNIHLQLPSQISAVAMAQKLDADHGTNIAGQIAAAQASGGSVSSKMIQRDEETGKQTGVVEIKYDAQTGFTLTQAKSQYVNGQLVQGASTTTPIGNTFMEQDLTAAVTAGSRLTGGTIQGLTFASPVEASIYATESSMSSSQVGDLVQNPAFQQAFMVQSMQTLGTANPLDPRIADAWNQATRSTQPRNVMGISVPAAGVPANQRRDLAYPGARQPDPSKADVNVQFGNKTIKLPGLPAYLNKNQGAGADINLGAWGAFAEAGMNFLASVMQPGGGPAPSNTQTPAAGPNIGGKRASAPPTTAMGKPPVASVLSSAGTVPVNPSVPPGSVPGASKPPSYGRSRGGGGNIPS